jgi:hypothetical protein
MLNFVRLWGLRNGFMELNNALNVVIVQYEHKASANSDLVFRWSGGGYGHLDLVGLLASFDLTLVSLDILDPLSVHWKESTKVENAIKDE